MSTLRAYITNLGLYNEGWLIGEWIEFPISYDDLKEVLKRIKIDETHEEWFFTDYDCSLSCFDSLGEYESIARLNHIGELLQTAEEQGLDDQINACLELGLSFEDAFQKAQDGNVIFIGENTGNMNEVIGEYYLDLFGGVSNLDLETRKQYFDYEALGRDVRLEYCPMDEEDPETAGEFWCGNEDASDEEIGEAIVGDLGYDGISNPENYFDTEEWGREIATENRFVETDKGIFELISD